MYDVKISYDKILLDGPLAGLTIPLTMNTTADAAAGRIARLREIEQFGSTDISGDRFTVANINRVTAWGVC